MLSYGASRRAEDRMKLFFVPDRGIDNGFIYLYNSHLQFRLEAREGFESGFSVGEDVLSIFPRKFIRQNGFIANVQLLLCEFAKIKHT